MKIAITGATGFIGSNLAKQLAEQGNTIHALYRSEKKLARIQHKNIIPFKGDILNKASLRNCFQHCDVLFHTAAFAGVWAKNTKDIYRLNVDATSTILDLAKELGIARVVVTSTAGVYGPSFKEEITENKPFPSQYFVDYERSKSEMEYMIKNRVSQGQDIVIVNPTRVYGPGPMNESNSVTILIDKYVRGKWHFIPGKGDSTGNYVFVQDVVNGHILAWQKGKTGENYILGGDDLSYNAFFEAIQKQTKNTFWLAKIPLRLMLFLSKIMVLLAKIFGIRPRITPGLVLRYACDWRVSSKKASTELGYEITPFDKGLQKTLHWLKTLQNE